MEEVDSGKIVEMDLNLYISGTTVTISHFPYRAEIKFTKNIFSCFHTTMSIPIISSLF